jgi:hypothetical protein
MTSFAHEREAVRVHARRGQREQHVPGRNLGHVGQRAAALVGAAREQDAGRDMLAARGGHLPAAPPTAEAVGRHAPTVAAALPRERDRGQPVAPSVIPHGRGARGRGRRGPCGAGAERRAEHVVHVVATLELRAQLKKQRND